jgi:hypothetical protein
MFDLTLIGKRYVHTACYFKLKYFTTQKASVFSERFVNEMRKGIEKYRIVDGKPNRDHVYVDNDGSRFSPIADPHESERRGSNSSAENEGYLTDDHIAAASSSSDSESSTQSDGDSSDVDVLVVDDDSTTQDEKLLVPTDLNELANHNESSQASPSSSRSPERTAAQRQSIVITNSDLVDLGTKLLVIEKEQASAQFIVDRITTSIRAAEDGHSSLDGSELLNDYTRCRQNQEQLQEQMVLLHGLANQRHALEQEIVRYLRWTQKTVSQDSQDLVFCHELEQKLKAYRKVHVAIKGAHDELVHDEEQAAMAQIEQERIRQEQEEAERMEQERIRREQEEAEETERFRQEALRRETEARPGMVWNPTTGEYQAWDTTETWRD